MQLTAETKKYILVAVLVHFLLLVSVTLDIPVFRQIVVFGYLLFVPGFSILTLLKISKNGLLDVALLSVGLSIASLMFLGLIVNELYPRFGMSTPLSAIPLLLTVSEFTLIVFILGVRRNALWLSSVVSNAKIELSKIYVRALPLVVLPALGIVGAIYRDLAVPFLIVLVAVLFIVSVFSTRLIPPKMYPFLIFAICLALVLQYTLMSNHVMGNDSPLEYHVFQLTATKGQWMPLNVGAQVEVYYTSMLSITILPTVFSALLNVNPELLFKVLFPFVFCFIPLVLYKILSKQGLRSNASLLAALVFISSPLVFYGSEPLGVNRQIIGELFLVLSFLVMLESEISSNKRTLLLVIFGAATVVSHYSIMFIYLGYLAFIFLFSKIRGKSDSISAKFIVFMFALAFTWYSLFSSPMFPQIVSTVSRVVANFGLDLSNPAARSTELFASRAVSNQASGINWGLFALVHLFLLAGLFAVIFRPKNTGLVFKYRVSIFLSGLLFFAIFAVPNFAPILNFSRFYAITFLFLAPCFVVGGLAIFSFGGVIVRRFVRQDVLKSSLNVAMLVMVLIASFYFLSQSGFVNHVTGGSIQSYTLDWDRTLNLNMTTSYEPGVKINFYNAYTPDEDVASARWVQQNRLNNSLIYADSISIYHPLHVYGSISDQSTRDLSNGTYFVNGSLVYLRTINAVDGFVFPLSSSPFYIGDFNSWFNGTAVVYSNGKSVVYGSSG